MMLCFGAAVVLAGCYSDRAWTSADCWYRPREEQVRNPDWTFVEPARVLRVTADKLQEAERLLEGTACVTISAEAAEAFAGRKLSGEPGMDWHLVRGVILTSNGHYRVARSNEMLLVHYGCLGRFPVKMKRQPLILQLPSPPGEVFVECSMAS